MWESPERKPSGAGRRASADIAKVFILEAALGSGVVEPDCGGHRREALLLAKPVRRACREPPGEEVRSEKLRNVDPSCLLRKAPSPERQSAFSALARLLHWPKHLN